MSPAATVTRIHQPTPAAPTPPVNRMKLADIKATKQAAALLWFLYTVEGLGKSTFGSEAPSPIFIAAESGLKRIDAQAFPQPQTFKDVLDAVDELTNTEHGYKTLVIDTLDWLEPLIWKDVCEKAKVASIEDVGGGYGKGYLAALDTWRLLLARLERLHSTKNMEIGLLAHTTISNFPNPNGPDYKRFQPAFHTKACDLVKQWVDVVMFGNYEDVYGPDAGNKRGKVKGVSTGKRELFTERTAAYDAKNRYGLPPVLPLSYAAFAEAAHAGHAGDPTQLAAECRRLAATQPDSETILAYITANETNVAALAQTLNTLRVMEADNGNV